MPRRKPKQQDRLMVGDRIAPDEFVGAVAAAWNQAATMESAYLACPRRECRERRRCRAAHGVEDERFCIMPLSREADKRALGMLTFLVRLAYDPPR